MYNKNVMGLINLLFKDPVSFFILTVPLLYSVILHEISHGVVAYWFGDDTAKEQGRLSLNPIYHIDPYGLLCLLLVGFGWARPVPVNFYRLRNNRLAIICVSLAGCFTNIIIATIAIGFLYHYGDNYFASILFVIARINIILGAFNLIPIPPLDGSKVLMNILPRNLQLQFLKVERFGFLILIMLLFSGALDPVINFVQGIISFFIVKVLGIG